MQRIIIAIICLNSIFAFSQTRPYLQADHEHYQETVIFQPGELVRLKCNDGAKFEGELKILNDKEVLIGNDTSSIADFSVLTLMSVKRQKTGKIIRNIGFGLMLAGAITAGIGYIYHNEPSDVLDFTGIVIKGLGISTFAVGGISVLSGYHYARSGQKYKRAIGWKFSVVL